MKKVMAAMITLIILGCGLQAHAAFSTPLSWYPMYMLDITFDAATRTLAVAPPPGPSLLNTETLANGNGTTPNPASYARFDPSRPWSVLNDKVFSRRFGWNDPNEFATDGSAILDRIRAVYGNDAHLWIEVIDQSMGLKSYQAVGLYGVNADDSPAVDPAAHGYAPIFGTAGSSPRWRWDGTMDHNTYAVPLAFLSRPNQEFFATYRIYVGDSQGNALAASPSATTTWKWTGPSALPPDDGTPPLVDRGNGMYYDRHLDLTWYNATSAGQVLTEADYEPISGQPRKFPLREYLTTLSVNGVTGWRLPTMLRIDLAADPYSVSAGELGYLFTSHLGGVPRVGLPVPYAGVVSGLKRALYWTGTVAQDNGMVSYFILDFDTGKWSIDCGMEGMSFGNYLLAVHDGDVGGTAVNAGPRVVISTPADSLVTRNARLTMTGTVTDSDGVATLTINGAAVSVSADGSFTHLLQLRDGASTITTIATDTGGRQTVDTRTVTLSRYAPPPQWNPMTMLDVGFDAATRKLSIQSLESKLTQYGLPYPALNVAPDGTFDPAQPWGLLNGTALSRQLGWNDPFEGATDGSAILDKIRAAYGADATIWIEAVSQTGGLRSYLAVGKYGVNADDTPTVDPAAGGYTPIFGTSGSPGRWRWDGKMDHNTYAVPLTAITRPNQMFYTTYRLYVGDRAGTELLNQDGSSTAVITVWSWQGPAEVPGVSVTLLDRGNGMFYDTVQNLTWYLAEADSRIKHHWTARVNSIPTALEYVASLSVNGISGWRLPTGKASSNPDPYAASGELGALFYRSLGGGARTGLPEPYPGPYSGLLQRGFYWTGTLVSTAGGMNSYAILDFDTGKWAMDCGMPTMSFGNYLLAVHDGDVAAPETPQSGDFNGDGSVDVTDALLALRSAVGLLTPNSSQLRRGDVAPFISGKPQPDGVIDAGDALVILRRVVGLIAW